MDKTGSCEDKERVPGVNSYKPPRSGQGGRILVMNGQEGATLGGVALEEDIEESLPDPSCSPCDLPWRAEEDSRLSDRAQTKTGLVGI